jgi:D-glycero-D-manno-heptose 1,7-bisphosphate phosphatase
MPWVILDRDGVINYDSHEYIKSPAEWHAIPGSADVLQRIHKKFIAELAAEGGQVADIFFCPHHPDEGCVCRKPQPGLFLQIQEKYAVNLSETFYVGDSLSDVMVARHAGCKPILVLTGNGKRTLESLDAEWQVPSFADLAQAVEFILHAK